MPKYYLTISKLYSINSLNENTMGQEQMQDIFFQS